jgi:cytochrome c oxidase subunit 2
MPVTTTAAVDSTFIYIMVFCFLLFAVIMFLMLYFVVRYRRSRNPNPSDISGNAIVETVWIAASVVLALSMFFYGLTSFKFLRAAPADSMNVKVTARQWSWLFTYANGRKSTDLVVPQGKNVALDMKSVDVIHGFFIPSYRIKQDVLPTMTTHAWFKAVDLGTFDILCTQYCGLQHSKMLSQVFVVPPPDFDKWYAGQDVDIPGLTSQAEKEEGTGVALLRQSGCLDCHSLDGTKLVGPTFKGLSGSTVEVLTGGKRRSLRADEAYIIRSIVDPGADIVAGFSDIMPAGRGKYSDAQLHEMVESIAGAD